MDLFENICLVTAVDIEFNAAVSVLRRPVVELIDGFRTCRGRLDDRQASIFQSGMGALGFADFLSERLAAERFSSVIVGGLAGALSPDLKRCSTIVYDRCFDARYLSTIETFNKSSPMRDEKVSIHCDTTISGLIYRSLIDKDISCQSGSGVTLDRIVTRSREKIKLGEQFNSLAVDMESYDILNVASKHNLPAAAVRIISDETSHDLPDFNRALDDQGHINSGRLFREMISSPLSSARFLIGIRPASVALRQTMSAILSVSYG